MPQCHISMQMSRDYHLQKPDIKCGYWKALEQCNSYRKIWEVSQLLLWLQLTIKVDCKSEERKGSPVVEVSLHSVWFLTSSSPGWLSTRTIPAWSEKDTLADWLGGLSVPKKPSSLEPFPVK